MPARKVVSDAQMLLLLQYMEEHRDLAVGHVANKGPLEKQDVARQWEELAATLNSVGVGATKTWPKWRDYWADKKYNVRKKASDLRLHACGTGGGPPKRPLTEIEERILALLGKVAVEGQDCVRIPFPLSQDSPMPSCSAQAAYSLPYIDPMPSIEEPAPVSASSPLQPNRLTLLFPSAAAAPASRPSSMTSMSSLPQPPSSPAAAPASRPSSLPQPPSSPAAAPASTSSGLPLPRLAEVPRWALDIETRRTETAELQARALGNIATTMASNQNVLNELAATSAAMLRTLKNIETFLAKIAAAHEK